MSDKIPNKKMVIIFALGRFVFTMILLLVLSFYSIILMKMFIAVSGLNIFSEESWVWPSDFPVIGDLGVWKGLFQVWLLILLIGFIGVPAFYVSGIGVRSSSSALTKDAP